MKPQAPRPLSLPLPVLGLARDVSPDAQPEGTSRELLNVRTVAGSTGEVGLALRGGLKRLSREPVRSLGTPVRSVFPFDWPQADVRLSRRTPPAKAWEALAQEGVLDVAVDGQGAVYVLLASGGVAVFNPDGESIGRLAPPTPVGFEPVRRLVLDLEGGVWIGATRAGETEGGSGRLWRFVRQPNDEFEQFSELALTGGVADFDVRFADIALITHGTGDEEGKRFLARAGSAFAALPKVFDERELPSASWLVMLARDRGALVVAPPDPERSTGAPGAFTDRSVSWTPRELIGWETRIHGWLAGSDPQVAGAPLIAGDEVTDVDDERFRETEVGVTADTLERSLQRDPRGVYGGPRWNPDAFGGRGGLTFDPGAQLSTRRASSTSDPLLNPTLIPQGERWALFLVVQPIRTPGGDWITGNLLTQAWDPVGAPLLGLELVATQVGIDVYDPTGLRASWNGLTTEAAVLITIVFEGAAAATSRLRINGDHIANVTFAVEGTGSGWTEVTGVDVPGPRTIIGSPAEPEPPNLLLRTGVVFSAIAGTFLLGPQLIDGITEQRSSNPTLRPEGATLLVNFGAAQRVSSIKFYQRSESRRAQRIHIKAATDAGLSVSVVDFGEFEVGNTRTFMDIALPETTSRQYWGITYVENAPGSNDIWEIQELEFHDRVQQQLANDVGAAFELGAALVLLEPANPGAVNATGSVGDLPADVTDIEAVEGYLAHDFGIAHLLPVDHVYTGAGNPPLGAGELSSKFLDRGRLRSNSGILAKFRPNGVLSWAENGPGYGYGLGIGPDEELWSLGSREAADGASAPWLRRILDLGGSVQTTGDGTLAVQGTEALEPAARPVRLAVDGCGSVHIPIVRPRTRESLVESRDTTGGIVSEYRPSCSSAIVAVAAGLDVIQPADLLPCGADYLAVALAGRACGAHRVDLIERESIEVDGPRGVGILAVSGGEAVAYNLRTGAQLVVGAGEQFDASRIVRGVQAFGRLFLSDGLVVRVFDPLRRSFTVLKGRFYGTRPSGFSEVELHAGRLYMAGSPEDPRGLFATARGEPTDFDIAPPVPLRGQAFTLAALDRIGAVPHGITGLASLGDDVMVVWTARSMHVLNGDPTEGGGLDLVTPDIGMSKGAPWTRSPEGELYWIDDYGSPWRYARGGIPERIGVGRIDETLRRLDLRNVRPALVWSREDDGLHIFLTPRGLRAESRRHLFWCRRTDAWVEDSYALGAHEPLSAAVMRGDTPNERPVVIGCSDGHLRALSRAVGTDDGQPIFYDALIGPAGLPQPGELLFTSLSVELAKSGGPAEIGVHASDEADAAGRVGPRRALRPGANLLMERWAGRWLWVRFRGLATQQWVARAASVEWFPAGRRRIR